MMAPFDVGEARSYAPGTFVSKAGTAVGVCVTGLGYGHECYAPPVRHLASTLAVLVTVAQWSCAGQDPAQSVTASPAHTIVPAPVSVTPGTGRFVLTATAVISVSPGDERARWIGAYLSGLRTRRHA
jgi:hypothetical protein